MRMQSVIIIVFSYTYKYMRVMVYNSEFCKRIACEAIDLRLSGYNGNKNDLVLV